MKVFNLKSRLRVMQASKYFLGEQHLFPCSSFVKPENLEEIKLNDCRILTVFDDSGSISKVLPKLRSLEFNNLLNLVTFCKCKMSWPSIERIEVSNCPNLMKLPLSTQNANTIKEIRGELEWWGRLELVDEGAKLSLEPYFQQCTLPIPPAQVYSKTL